MKKMLLGITLLTSLTSFATTDRARIQNVIKGLKQQETSLNKTAQSILDEASRLKQRRQNLEITLQAPSTFTFSDRGIALNVYGDGSKKGSDPISDEDIRKKEEAIKGCTNQTGEDFKQAYDNAMRITLRQCQKDYSSCDELVDLRNVYFDNSGDDFYSGFCKVSVKLKGSGLRIDE